MNDVDIQTKLRLRAENEIPDDIDSIWVYGNQAQSKLTEFSKAISKAALQNSSQAIESALESVIVDIDALSSKETFRFSSGASRRRQYLSALKSMDEITVQLRLQQAQLLKNKVIYERMGELIENCCQELEIYIDVGKAKLGRPKETTKIMEPSDNLTLWNQEDWDARFQRKMDELHTCFVIASQSKVQAELMQNNCSILAAKIGASLGTTIPIWRNQIALMLGIEDYEMGLATQAKLNAALSANLKRNKKTLKDKIKSLRKTAVMEIDETDALPLNRQLAEALHNLASLNKENGTTQQELQGVITRISSIGTTRY